MNSPTSSSQRVSPEPSVKKAPFFHPRSLVDDGAHVGAGTRVWAFAHIVSGAQIGEECNLCDHTFFEGRVIVGNRVTVKCGVYLWDGIIVEDDVFIGPCAAFTNDLRPRSRQYPAEYPKTILQRGCSIGANATVLPGITIGPWSMVAAGAIVTRDVPAYALVVGNPARFRNWICCCAQALHFGNADACKCNCGRRFRLVGEDRVEEVQS